jgi:chromosome segregation ATPase
MTHITTQSRRRMIAEAAYFRAQRCGFNSDPFEDWLNAEREIDSRLDDSGTAAEKFEERLAAANERLKVLRHRLTELTDEAHDEWEAEVGKLARQRDRFRQRIREIKERSGHAAEKAMSQAEKLWDEFSAAIERLSSRHDKPSE